MRFNIKKIILKGILCIAMALTLVGGAAVVDMQYGGADTAYASENMTVQLEKTKMSLVSKTSSSIKVKWTAVQYADGYTVKIFRGNNTKPFSTYEYGKNSSRTLCETGLTTAAEYRFEVTAWAKKKGNVTYKSSTRVYRAHSALKTPKMQYVKTTNGAILIDWDGVSRVDGYEVYRKSGSGSWKKLCTITGKSYCTNTQLYSSGKYSYKVRAYYKCCGYTFYSSYSSSKSIDFKVSKATIINTVKLTPMKTNRTSLDKTVDGILDEILDGKVTNYAKLKAIYEWTYKNIYYKFPKYPYKTYPYVSSHDKTVVVQAELALKNRYGVCNDYAAVFQVLARRAGFEAFTINGSAYWGGQWDSHSWNMVRIGSSWYRVDTQIQRLKSGKNTDYTFFMQTDSTDWGVKYPNTDKQKTLNRFGKFKLKNGKTSC